MPPLNVLLLLSPATTLVDDFVHRLEEPGLGALALCAEEFRYRSGLSCEMLSKGVREGNLTVATGPSQQVADGVVTRLDARAGGLPLYLWVKAQKGQTGWALVDGSLSWEDVARLGGGPAVPPVTPSPFTQRLLPALSGGPEALLPFCTPAFRDASEDGPARFARQAQAKGFTYTVVDDSSQGDRRLVVLDVLVNGRPVDRIWLFVVREGSDEHLDLISENRRHADLFLAGVIPGQIDVAALPDDPTLRRFGEELLLAAPYPAEHPDVTKLHTLVAPRLVRTWTLDALGTGAICYESTSEAPYTIEVQRDGASWRIVGSGYGFRSCSGTLRALMP